MKQSYKWSSVLAIILVMVSCQYSQQSILNEQASVTATDELPEDPLLLVPLTSFINARDTTMSTLYGNEIALFHAKTEANNSYPKGSLLYEVTWKQQPDSVWFGANIPKEIISVERILFNDSAKTIYDLYKGSPLRKSNAQNNLQRIEFISSQRMAVSP